MFVPWKLRWRWLFIGLVMVAIAFQVLSRFSFSQSSWAGNLQRLCGFNQSKFEKFSSPKAQFILDLKFSSEPGSEYEDAKRLLGLVDKHLRRDQVILFGGYEVLRNYKGRGVSLGYTALFSEGWNKYRFSLGHQFLLDRRRELKCDYLVLPSVFLNQSLIEESEKSGIDVWAYGINGASDWKASVDRGVTGLIVDDLEAARKTFIGRSSER